MIFSYAMSQLNSLTLTVLKANRARTAQPLRERNPFLPETQRTNKTTDTGVALTSNNLKYKHKLPQNSAHRFQ